MGENSSQVEVTRACELTQSEDKKLELKKGVCSWWSWVLEPKLRF